MGRRLILDTNVLIDVERGRTDFTAFDDDDVAIAALTVAEYRVGIDLAGSSDRADMRARALAVIMDVVDVLDYTETTAAHHARLMATIRTSGRARAAHDLVIAAHAVETDRVLVSHDAAARFGELPGVRAVEPPAG